MPEENHCKIFISHASADEAIVSPIVDMIFDVYDFHRESGEIMYTGSRDTGLKNWSNFNDSLRQALRDCDVVIVFLSSNYIKRPYCLYELGAIWGLNKQGFLIRQPETQGFKLPDITLALTYDDLSEDCLDGISDCIQEAFSEKKKIGKNTTWGMIKKRTWQSIQQVLNNPAGMDSDDDLSGSNPSETSLESPLKWERQQPDLFADLITALHPFYSLVGKQIFISEDIYVDKPIERTVYYLLVVDDDVRKEHKLWLLDRKDNSVIKEYPETFSEDRVTNYHLAVLDKYAKKHCTSRTFIAYSPYSIVEEEPREQARLKKSEEIRKRYLQKEAEGTLTEEEKKLMPFMFRRKRTVEEV